MSGRRVLVVDDNDDHRNWLAGELALRGWDVSMARTGRAALDLAATLQPNVIVSELALPDVGALHLPRAARSMIAHAIKMIALTHLPIEMHEGARQAGFDYVLSKTGDLEELHGDMAI